MENIDLIEGFLNVITDKIAGKIILHIENQSRCESEESEEFDDKYLTRDDVLRLCHIKSYSTLWSWKKNGLLIPIAKAGRKVLYSKKDVVEFLKIKKGGFDD